MAAEEAPCCGRRPRWRCLLLREVALLYNAMLPPWLMLLQMACGFYSNPERSSHPDPAVTIYVFPRCTAARASH